MPNILIIGGSDAGISAALRIKELDGDAVVTLVLADEFPNFSICGIPFFLSGETPDWHDLAHRTRDQIEAQGIDVLSSHRALSIDAQAKTIEVQRPDGATIALAYDKLILATGAVPSTPKIEGLGLTGVFFLRWMGQALDVHEFLRERQPRHVTLVGGGYIGMEMADALRHRGHDVRVVEHNPTVLKTVDREFGETIGEILTQHGVEVVNGKRIHAIEKQGERLCLTGSDGFSTENDMMSDMVLVATGSRPMTELAASAGVACGPSGAICVDATMRTNVDSIFAAGDCVETWNRILQTFTYQPLGSTAHKQGRTAGENALGGRRKFAGTLGTQVIKIFDAVVGRTGLKDDEAREHGLAPLTVESEHWDHKVYYPDAQRMRIRLTADRQTRRLLGAQILGHVDSEVAKRIDTFAAAIFHGMTVEALNDLDLSYTPPLSSPWDPVQMAAQAWARKIEDKKIKD